MFKNFKIKNFIKKIFGIGGSVLDLRTFANSRGWNTSEYRYNWSYTEFYNMCLHTYNTNSDLQEGLEILIANCAELPICLKSKKDKKIIDKPPELQEFLMNPLQSGEGSYNFFLKFLVSYFIGGEVSFYKDYESKKIIYIRPDEISRIKIYDGKTFSIEVSSGFFSENKIKESMYLRNQSSRIFEVFIRSLLEHNQITHFLNPNLTVRGRGLSMVAGLLNHVGVLKEGPKWNFNLLLNDARPSGVLSYPKPLDSGQMMRQGAGQATVGQEQIEDEVKTQFAGAGKCGKGYFT